MSQITFFTTEMFGIGVGGSRRMGGLVLELVFVSGIYITLNHTVEER